MNKGENERERGKEEKKQIVRKKGTERKNLFEVEKKIPPPQKYFLKCLPISHQNEREKKPKYYYFECSAQSFRGNFWRRFNERKICKKISPDQLTQAGRTLLPPPNLEHRLSVKLACKEPPPPSLSKAGKREKGEGGHPRG